MSESWRGAPRHLDLEHFGETRDEPEPQRAAVHLEIIRVGRPVLDGRLHAGGEPGRFEEPTGARGHLDRVGLALQLGERRPIIARQGQALGHAEEPRERCVPTHGYQDIGPARHRPTQRRMLSSVAQRLVPMTR